MGRATSPLSPSPPAMCRCLVQSVCLVCMSPFVALLLSFLLHLLSLPPVPVTSSRHLPNLSRSSHLCLKPDAPRCLPGRPGQPEHTSAAAGCSTDGSRRPRRLRSAGPTRSPSGRLTPHRPSSTSPRPAGKARAAASLASRPARSARRRRRVSCRGCAAAGRTSCSGGRMRTQFGRRQQRAGTAETAGRVLEQHV